MSILLGSTVAVAGVEVYPLYLFLKPPSRTVSVSVTNPTEKRQEAWVEFKYGYPVVGDSGKFAMQYLDSPYVNEPSAVSWLRAFPQRFVLGPRESQVVRIMVSPPIGIAPGEYWARVVVSSFDRELKTSTTAPGGSMQMHLQYISQIDIPLHCRIGHVTTGLTVTRMTATASAGKLNLGVGLTRVGNASFWGTMSITLKNRDGQIVKNEDRPIAIYKDIVYPYSIDISGVPPGSYTLEAMFTTHRPGVASGYELKADPVKISQELTIP
ncbi:MAG: hypothetical protein E6K56_03125 [Ignavibacteria bacterium]|nr:MAG: hypothetical protein E6K56_03125 [Ignavibacteria bacterium]